MKNKKKTFMGLALLLAVLILGVGYALTASDLIVSLGATAEKTEGFNVIFSAAEKVSTDTDTAKITEIKTTGDTTASMTVSLKNLGDTVTGKFTVKNDSLEGINADFANANIVVDPATSSYFTIEVTKAFTASTVLEPEATTTFDVKVTLKQANVTDAVVTENFTITLSGIEAKAA